MRATMFVIGFGVIAWGYFLSHIFGYPIWITLVLGIFNIMLGVITPKSRKVDLRPEPSGTVKLVVDKVLSQTGRLRVSSYELVFLSDKLVRKKLTSWKPILLATGISIAIGGIFGGLTGLSVSEFLDQRKRDKIRERNEFATIAAGDLEVPYESMSQVQLDGEGLKMIVGGQSLMLRLAPEYPHLIAHRIRELIPNQCWSRAWSQFYP